MTTQNHYPVQFTGTGSEYFRIWIVNIALTLVTLGIYSAWAKVRNKRWFYGHCLVDDHSFGYHATPMQILKGRLIAGACLALYVLSSELMPALFGVLSLALFAASPWIIVKSLQFNARNSSYRGIRFNFDASMGDAAVNFFVYPLLTLVTLGLAVPFVVYKQISFIVNHYQYGATPVQFNTTSGPFWKMYGVAMLLMMAPVLLFVFIGGINFAHFAEAEAETEAGTMAGGFAAMIFLGILGLYLMLPVIGAYIKARIANLTYNHSSIGAVGFVSEQRARDLIWLYLSNIILIALTFGIFVPWAKVRMARYRAERLRLVSSETLEGFAAGVRVQVGATGGELADAFDFDIGIG